MECLVLRYPRSSLAEAARDNAPLLPRFEWPERIEIAVDPTDWLKSLLGRIFFEVIVCSESQERCVYFLQKQILNELVNIVFRSYETRCFRSSSAAGTDPGRDGEDFVEWVHFLSRNVHRKLTLRELEAFAGYSATEITRVFRSRLGTTPMAYHKRLRLEEARKLIGDGTLTVNGAAIAFGYSDGVSFRHAFKAAFGHPPRAGERK